MNKKILPLCVAFLIGLVALAYTVTAQSDPTPTPPATPTAPGGPHGGRHHSAIRGAIQALERAKGEMQAASNDFGGHKADALAACDAAIAQLKLALQYANQGNMSTPTPTPAP